MQNFFTYPYTDDFIWAMDQDEDDDFYWNPDTIAQWHKVVAMSDDDLMNTILENFDSSNFSLEQDTCVEAAKRGLLDIVYDAIRSAGGYN